MRSAKLGRAAGNDVLPAEIWKVQAPLLSRVLYPLLLKVAFRLSEPLQFKGGTMHKIWKNKGPLQDCHSYRGILVSSAAGKCIHGAFRRKCADWFEGLSTPLQLGGRRGFPVQLASHAARSFHTAALRQGYSVALVFLDLKEAFHRVARPLVHGGALDDQHVAQILSTFGIPPSGVSELHSYVREAALVRDAGASPWAAALLREFQSDTWFNIKGHLAVVRAGTRPGDSLADIVFSFLFASVLRRLRDALLAAGVSVQLPWEPAWAGQLQIVTSPPTCNLAPIDVSWMDDLVLLLWASSAQGLVDDVKRAAELLLDECVRALLHPSLAPGKTEAMVSLTGKDSRSLRISLFRGKDPALSLSPTVHPPAALRLVPRYKHLGGLLHWKGSLAFELRARIGQAWQAFSKHRRTIFASPIVTHREKALLFQSLVASTLYFGAGTWVYQCPSELDPIKGALLRMARQMLRPTYGWEEALHLGAGRVLATARLPSVDVEVHAARLRHLTAVLDRAPDEFWAILHFDGRWNQLALESIQWMRETLQQSGRALPDLSDWSGLAAIIRDTPRTWKRYIARAISTAKLAGIWAAEVAHYHGLLLRLLLKHGARPATDLLAGRAPCEVCAPCGRAFPNLRCWSHHAFKCHGRVREARLLASGTQCRACLRHFATNFRLCNHLHHSKKCIAALALTGEWGEVQPGKGSKGSKRFQHGDDQLCPAVTAAGPLRSAAVGHFTQESDRSDTVTIHALEDLFAHQQPHLTFDALLEGVRQAFSRSCLQVSRLRATAVEWRHNLRAELDRCDDVPITWAAWHTRIADLLCRVDFVSWLVPEPHDQTPGLSTFRDATFVLPWLALDLVRIPHCQVPPEAPLWLCARRCSIAGCDRARSVTGITFEQCFAEPGLLEFDTWSQQRNCVHGFCLVGLLDSIVCPSPLRSYQQLCPQIHRLRLFADAIRGTLYLWASGCPAFLIVPPIVCPGLEVIRQLALYSEKRSETTVLANFPGFGSFLSCFTI